MSFYIFSTTNMFKRKKDFVVEDWISISQPLLQNRRCHVSKGKKRKPTASPLSCLRPDRGFAHISIKTRTLPLSQALNISREAIARRFFELSHTQIVLIFHHRLTFRFVLKQDDFPRLSIWNAAQIPPINDFTDSRGVTKIERVELGDWLNGMPSGELSAQTLFQQNGFGMTLLVFDGEEDHGEDGVEDAFDLYNRWNRNGTAR